MSSVSNKHDSNQAFNAEVAILEVNPGFHSIEKLMGMTPRVRVQGNPFSDEELKAVKSLKDMFAAKKGSIYTASGSVEYKIIELLQDKFNININDKNNDYSDDGILLTNNFSSVTSKQHIDNTCPEGNPNTVSDIRVITMVLALHNKRTVVSTNTTNWCRLLKKRLHDFDKTLSKEATHRFVINALVEATPEEISKTIKAHSQLFNSINIPGLIALLIGTCGDMDDNIPGVKSWNALNYPSLAIIESLKAAKNMSQALHAAYVEHLHILTLRILLQANRNCSNDDFMKTFLIMGPLLESLQDWFTREDETMAHKFCAKLHTAGDTNTDVQDIEEELKRCVFQRTTDGDVRIVTKGEKLDLDKLGSKICTYKHNVVMYRRQKPISPVHNKHSKRIPTRKRPSTPIQSSEPHRCCNARKVCTTKLRYETER